MNLPSFSHHMDLKNVTPAKNKGTLYLVTQKHSQSEILPTKTGCNHISPNPPKAFLVCVCDQRQTDCMNIVCFMACLYGQDLNTTT